MFLRPTITRFHRGSLGTYDLIHTLCIKEDFCHFQTRQKDISNRPNQSQFLDRTLRNIAILWRSIPLLEEYMHATDVLDRHDHKVTVNVFTFQRSKQDAWSICRFGDIPIEPNSRFKYIVKIQFTGFNSQLVLLLVTIQRENIIWFQYQTDVENPDPPEIWNITQPGLADEILSSPSTGKVYLIYRSWPQRIDEYGFSDGLHIRSIALNISKLSFRDY